MPTARRHAPFVADHLMLIILDGRRLDAIERRWRIAGAAPTVR
jgi:hypothetical protein